jgi:hypothetical protein
VSDRPCGYDEATFYRSSTLGVEGGPRLIQGGPLGDFPQLDFGGRAQPDDLGFPAFGEVVIGLGIAEKVAESETAGEARIGMLEGQILTRAVAITAAHRNESAFSDGSDGLVKDESALIKANHALMPLRKPGGCHHASLRSVIPMVHASS